MTYFALLHLYNNNPKKSLYYFKKSYVYKQSLQTAVNLAYYYMVEIDYDSPNYNEEEAYFKSIEILENYIKNNVNISYILYSMLGECYFHIENYGKMEENLKKSISLNKNFINLFNLAVSLFKQNKYEESINYFEESIKYSCSSELLFLEYYIIICKLLLGKTDDILEKLDYVIENDKDDELEIEKVYLILKKYNKALEIYNKIDDYILSEGWFTQKLYCLYKINDLKNFDIEYKKFILYKEKDIDDNRKDSDYEIEYEEELKKELKDFEIKCKKILNNNYEIDKNFYVYIKRTCYFFGCVLDDNNYYV